MVEQVRLSACTDQTLRDFSVHYISVCSRWRRRALIDSVRLSLFHVVFSRVARFNLLLCYFCPENIIISVSVFMTLRFIVLSLSGSRLSFLILYIPKPQLLKQIRPLVRVSVFLFSKRFPSACLSGRAEFSGHAEEASDPGAGGGGLRRHRPPAVQHQPRPGGRRTPRQVRRGSTGVT